MARLRIIQLIKNTDHDSLDIERAAPTGSLGLAAREVPRVILCVLEQALLMIHRYNAPSTDMALLTIRARCVHLFEADVAPVLGRGVGCSRIFSGDVPVDARRVRALRIILAVVSIPPSRIVQESATAVSAENSFDVDAGLISRDGAGSQGNASATAAFSTVLFTRRVERHCQVSVFAGGPGPKSAGARQASTQKGPYSARPKSGANTSSATQLRSIVIQPRQRGSGAIRN